VDSILYDISLEEFTDFRMNQSLKMDIMIFYECSLAVDYFAMQCNFAIWG
jgi:hypothetical protein